MGRLKEDAREALIVATVDVVMEVRRLALAGGASPLKLWDQLASRTRAAARTTDSAPEWATKLLRDLQIAAPSRELSSAIEALAQTAALEGVTAWLDLLEREHGYVMARARLEAERRKDARAAGVAKCNASHPELARVCHRDAHVAEEDHELVIDGKFIHWRD